MTIRNCLHSALVMLCFGGSSASALVGVAILMMQLNGCSCASSSPSCKGECAAPDAAGECQAVLSCAPAEGVTGVTCACTRVGSAARPACVCRPNES